MDDFFLRRARECPFCRGSIRELADHLPADGDELSRWLEEVVRSRDERAFTHLLLAALAAGRRVDARHLIDGAALLPDPGQLAAAALHCSGDVAGALVDAVRRGRLGSERTATALLVAAWWCRNQAKCDVPPGVLTHAKLLARKADVGMSLLVLAPLVALADMLDDEPLRHAIGVPVSQAMRGVAKEMCKNVIERCRLCVLQHVPEEPLPELPLGFTVRRAVPRIGRNEPCPCGSGKKYKRCCLASDQERLKRSSEVAGVTVEELRENPEAHLTSERLRQLRAYELARFDPVRVPADLHPLLISRLLAFGEHEAVVELFEKLGFPESLEGHWEDAVLGATEAWRRDLVERLIEARGDGRPREDELAFGTRLLLSDEPAGSLFDVVEAKALKGLRGRSPIELVDLAYALTASPRSQALGILVARSVLPIASALDAETLFDQLLETRDRLGLSADDPFEAILDQRFADEDDEIDPGKEVDRAALSEARAQLARKGAEVREVRRELEALQKRIAEESRKPPAHASRAGHAIPPSATGESEASAALRARLASLKSDLKERHAERNALRRELQRAHEEIDSLRDKHAAPPPGPSPAPEAEGGGWLLDEESLDSQPIRVPRLPKKFHETLTDLPRPVASGALRLIGRLAAGDAAAFHGIKRLKLDHDVCRQRVGASHRLLFRLREDSLEILELLHRRDLERTIKAKAYAGEKR
jgi:hypothetical protein